MYFYLGNVGQGSTDYYDFIEYTIGTTNTPGVHFFNGDTTRVDAFAVKLAFNLTCGDGTNIAVGENAAAFAENRATTFRRYLDAVPSEFQPEATLTEPYRIVEPGTGGFNAVGPTRITTPTTSTKSGRPTASPFPWPARTVPA